MPNKKKTPKEVIEENMKHSEIHLEDLTPVPVGNTSELVESSNQLISYIRTVEARATDAMQEMDEKYLATLLSTVSSGALANFLCESEDDKSKPDVASAFKMMALYEGFGKE